MANTSETASTLVGSRGAAARRAGASWSGPGDVCARQLPEGWIMVREDYASLELRIALRRQS
eukprot:6222200-Amphidinium_carterae.7